MTSLFGNAAPQSNYNAKADADLTEIQTEQLGFQTISGDDKLRLLPQPWPAEQQPPPSASLLSIASKKGLVAAAGPDVLVIAATDQLREAFTTGNADNNIKPYTPQATLQIPRVNQVAFSSDESCLVIAAEQGGGLAIYETNALVNGNKDSAFQISTNGISVRHLLPNPNPTNDTASRFAIVLEGGQLLLADLKSQNLVNSAQGNPIFHENVTSACWSRLGKQIVAGRKDGTAVQIDTQGKVHAEIPVPPKLRELIDPRAQAAPLTSVYWLETHDFLLVHSPINPPVNDDTDMMDAPSDNSVLHLAHRDKATNTWSFQTVVDPSPAFIERGRVPAHHFIERLRDWPPNLDDTLILLSTVASDVGLMTKSKNPLNAAQPVVGSFTTTMVPDDRRAGMPVSVVDDISDTSVVGMAVDLSVKENISRPIKNDETLDASPVPLPALYVLNHEGLLRVWYMVYNESIRAKQAFPDLIAAGGPRPLDSKAQPAQSNSFGTSQPTPAAAAVASPFAKQSAFGAVSSAFGGTSSLGARPSPWSSNGQTAPAGPSSSMAKPTFGSPSSLGGGSAGGSGFGQVGTMGLNKQSLWGAPAPSTPNSNSGNGTVFGGNASTQSPFAAAIGASKGSSFASLGGNNTAPSPSATMMGKTDNQSKSPFATGGTASNETKPSIFGSAAGNNTEAKTGLFSSTLQSSNQTGLFGAASNTPSEPKPNVFGAPSITSNEGKPSPFAQPKKEPQKQVATGFGSTAKPTDEEIKSPFAKLGSTSNSAPSPFSNWNKDTNASPFQNANKQQQSLKLEPSGSTASFSSFASAGSGQTTSNGLGSFSFAKPSVSRETTMGEETKPSGLASGTSGLFGSSTNFKLGSTFKGDGSAASDGPKPKDVSSSLFGSAFGATLSETQGSTATTTPAIKQEPGTKEEPKLADIPAAPQPKQFASADDPYNYKPKRFAGDVPPSDVPPSDPPQTMPKRFAGDLPPVDVPLEKSPPPTRAPSKSGDVPLAGSPPVDLGKSHASASGELDIPPAPEDDDDEDWEEEEGGQDDREEGDEEDEEGADSAEDGEEDETAEEEDEDDEDDDEEDDEEDHPVSPPSDPKALAAFMSRVTPASPKQKDRAVESRTPATEKKPSFTPAGFPKAPINFGFPGRNQDSPRSPSPQRAVTSPLFSPRPGASSGFPGTTPAPKLGQGPTSLRTQQPPQRIAVPPTAPVERPSTRVKPAEPESGSLEDEEDAEVQAILGQPPKATKEMPFFLAHQNYVGNSAKEGIGGQIERVYRDINSMLDTLGLNAHSLSGFLKGQKELGKPGRRDRGDLDDEHGWVLDEMKDLGAVEDVLRESLEAGKLDDVEQKKRVLYDIERTNARIQLKANAIRRFVATRTDPAKLNQQHMAPLPSEAQVQRAELRAATAEVGGMLAKAEEALSELRADLASKHTAGKGPTVEAVINTILKMTSMIQRKSGDVDVLEAQIRRLPHGLPSSNVLASDYEDDLVSAMRASRLPAGSPRAPATPGRTASKRTAFNGDALGMSGMLGSSRFRTPPHNNNNRRSIMFSPEASMLGRSVGSLNGGGSARKRMQDVTDQEVQAYERKADSRQKVMDALRGGIEKRGTRIVVFE